ncbi:MAG TPA: hypothetical protein VEK15_22155 [Vicinamibacteria bacterium]|nr:hypothetical protein [Vicinamibacteria bacterium]
MTLLAWMMAALVGAQSLGEVAAREKKRREKNAEAGVEVVSYTGSGEGIAADEASISTPDARAPEETESSPLEEEWARGESYEPRFAEISRAADEVDALFERYMDTCYNRYLIGVTPPGLGVPVLPGSPFLVHTGRNWFVVLENPSVLGPSTATRYGGNDILLVQLPQCEGLWERLVTQADHVRRAMRELLEDARRERILPGVIRDLRRKYRLEWSGWER